MVSFAIQNILSALENIMEIKIISIAIDKKIMNLDFWAELIHLPNQKAISITQASDTFSFNLSVLSMGFACLLNIYCSKILLLDFLSSVAFIAS